MWVTLKQKLLEGRRLFITSLSVASFVLVLRFLGLLQPFELPAFDLLLRLRPKEPPDMRLLIVTITEADIQAQKQDLRPGTSLSDRSLAQLLEKLESYKPQAIGLDIYRDFPVGTGYPDLVKRLKQSNRFISVCKVSTETNDPGISPPPEVPVERLGFSDVVIDPDGVLRRHLLALTPHPASPCTASYALSSQLALRYLAAKGLSPEITTEGYLQLGTTIFKPLEAHGGGYQNIDAWGHQVLLNYRSYRSASDFVPQVTLTQVLNGQLTPDAVKDKIVLIGVTAPSRKDYFFTPYSPIMRRSKRIKDVPAGISGDIPGVVIHAQMVSQILSAVLDRRPLINVWSNPIEWLWILGWSLVGATLSWNLLVPRWSIIGISLAGVSLTSACYLALCKDLWLPLVPPILTLVGSAVVTQIVMLFGFELGRGVESNIYAAIELYRSRNGKGKNYHSINLRKLNLMGAVLTDANLSGADLAQANLKQANLKKANLAEVQALETDFSEANLTEANLSGANLSGANLSKANLSGANLAEIQALNTDFSEANITGSCINNWGINTKTNFTDVRCDYIYLEQGSKERKPDSGFFGIGDFEKLIVRSTKTLDLLFRNGIEPQAFDFAFQELLKKHGEMGISINSIEDVGDGDRLVRLRVDNPQANKAILHENFFQDYKLKQKQLATARQRLATAREHLAATQGQLAAEKRQSEYLQELIRYQIDSFSRPALYAPNSHFTGDPMADKSNKIQIGDVSGSISGFAGGDISGIAGQAGGDISGTVTNTINQLQESDEPEAPKLADLLKQLQEAIEADTNLSEEDKAEALEQLRALAEAGQNPKEATRQKAAKKATTMLKGIISGLSSSAQLVGDCNKLLPLITSLFGLG